MNKLTPIYDDLNRVVCHATEMDIEIAGLYFRENGFNTIKAAMALTADGAHHSVYEWLAIAHEAKNRLDRDLQFRGAR